MLRTGPTQPLVSQLLLDGPGGRLELDDARDTRAREASSGASPIEDLESHWATSIDSATD